METRKISLNYNQIIYIMNLLRFSDQKDVDEKPTLKVYSTEDSCSIRWFRKTIRNYGEKYEKLKEEKEKKYKEEAMEEITGADGKVEKKLNGAKFSELFLGDEELKNLKETEQEFDMNKKSLEVIFRELQSRPFEADDVYDKVEKALA